MSFVSLRFFGCSSAVRNAELIAVLPKYAAKQFIPDNATKSKIKSLRRKELRLRRQIIRDVNNLKKQSLKAKKFEVDPVLGEPSNPFIKRIYQEIEEPTHLAYGFERKEVEKLLYGAEKANLNKVGGNLILAESIKALEERKRRALLTIHNIKNTDDKDKKSLAIKHAREEFQRKEGDTASPEVQAAILTVKIHFAMEHVKRSAKDKVSIQHVREMVQQRQKVLKYLKKDDPERYYHAIAKLGLTDDVVTSEFNMDRQYLQDFKVWGEKTLVKLSEKQEKKRNKINELQKRVQQYNQLAKQNYDEIQRRFASEKQSLD